MTEPTPPAEGDAAASFADPDEIVGWSTGRFGVKHPGDGHLVKVQAGDPIPAWMAVLIAASNWTTGEEQPDADTAAPAEGDHPGASATVKQILAWVAGDPERAEHAAEVEHGTAMPRSTLMAKLDEIIDGTD